MDAGIIYPQKSKLHYESYAIILNKFCGFEEF
jgi:hypothetical protein